MITEQTLLPVGVRVWTSLLTLIGVFLIKLGFYRVDEVELKEDKKNKKGKERAKVLDDIDEME